MTSRIRLCVLILLCSGCGRGPAAIPPRNVESSRYKRPVHFVERGTRTRAVFVEATEGYPSPFSAIWTIVLVPVAPSPLAGPAWTGRSVGGDRARAIATLPSYRDATSLELFGDPARRRFRQHFVWVLGTDPFILGLPHAAPQPNWTMILTPQNPWSTQFVTDEDLDQSVGGLVVYPPGFWEAVKVPYDPGMEVSVVTLEHPMRVNDALDAIAAGDPSRLGKVRSVRLDEESPPEAEQSRPPHLDRDRLANE
jgi:hypothetical protein